MARIFITGSADGLGQMAANLLVNEGHRVVLHARNAERSRQALGKVPGAEKVLTADLSSIVETQQLAAEVNTTGLFDAVIHNAGGYRVPNKEILAVNTLAPYMLTCLIQRPHRLIYLGSDMHMYGDSSLKNLTYDSNHINYSDSKLHIILLSMAVARKWPEVYANAVDPGWVPTKMGGPGAPDDLDKGAETQAWLAVSNDATAKVSGRYLYHKRKQHCRPEASDTGLQEKFLALCEQITGVPFPHKK